MTLAQKIIETTRETFATMIGMEVRAVCSLENPNAAFRGKITGMVGLAGACKGVLVIHASEEMAKAVTGNFLGLEIKEINEEVKDAIGELVNILAGGVKMALSSNGKGIKLSIPSTICGKGYSLDFHSGGDGIIVPFTSPAGNFLVELNVQKDVVNS